MFGSLFFIFWRIVEITFLIPIIGMLVRTAATLSHTICLC